MSRIVVLLCLVLAPVALAACSGDGIDEDALVIYSGRNEDLVGPLVTRFERETGIKTAVKYADSPELAATLIEEGKNSPADVFFSQDAGALGAVANAKLLMALPAATLARVPDAYRSTRDLWVGTSARARVLAYDKRKLKAGDLPASVLDLTDPTWRGRVAWAPTNASFQTFITAMRRVRGEQQTQAWLEAMKNNDVQPYENNIAIRDAIANGEVEVGLINHYYVAEAIAEKGPSYPVAITAPERGDIGGLVNVAGVGVLTGTDRQAQAQAQRFVDFLLSAASQRYFVGELKEYSVFPDGPVPTGVKPLQRTQGPDVALDDLSDLQGTVDLLQRTGVL